MAKNANGLPLLECLHLAAILVDIIEPGLAEQGDSDIHKFHPQVTLGNMVKLTFHLQYVKHLASDAGSVNSDAGKVMESEEKPTSLKKKTEMPTRSNFLEKCLRISNFSLIVNFIQETFRVPTNWQ